MYTNVWYKLAKLVLRGPPADPRNLNLNGKSPSKSPFNLVSPVQEDQCDGGCVQQQEHQYSLPEDYRTCLNTQPFLGRAASRPLLQPQPTHG